MELGEKAGITIGIINHEYKTVSYIIELTVNGEKYSRFGPVTLLNEEKFEQDIIFTPEIAGQDQKIEFFLYKNGEAEPYMEPLRLWIDVK